MNSLTNPSPNAAFMVALPTVDERNRLQRYITYLDSIGGHWSRPDLAVYRDWLLANGLRSSTVRAYVVTVRQRYKQLLKDNAVRDMLYSQQPTDYSPADAFAAVSEALTRLANATDPDKSKVKQKVIQEKADSQHRRLTPEEGRAVMNLPGLNTLRGVRDSAIITLMLCTGLRREEVCNLVISDLYETLMGEPALLVREGKGAKQRLVIYGEYREWVIPVCEYWLKKAGHKDGALFRTLTRPHSKTITEHPMSVRTINNVFDKTGIEPHDARRTYAKWLELSGMPIQEIQRQLGHESVDTTLGYIGDKDVTRRIPKSVLRYGD